MSRIRVVLVAGLAQASFTSALQESIHEPRSRQRTGCHAALERFRANPGSEPTRRSRRGAEVHERDDHQLRAFAGTIAGR